MSLDPLTAAFDLGKIAIEKLWPDPSRRAEELRKLEELKQQGDLSRLNASVKLMLAQIEVNKEEAKSKSLFIAGWRPFIGWAGGFSLAYAGLIYPILLWAWSLLQAFSYIPSGVEPPPFVESATLGAIVTGMLGIGGMRSYDKKNRVHTDKL